MIWNKKLPGLVGSTLLYQQEISPSAPVVSAWPPVKYAYWYPYENTVLITFILQAWNLIFKITFIDTNCFRTNSALSPWSTACTGNDPKYWKWKKEIVSLHCSSSTSALNNLFKNYVTIIWYLSWAYVYKISGFTLYRVKLHQTKWR